MTDRRVEAAAYLKPGLWLGTANRILSLTLRPTGLWLAHDSTGEDYDQRRFTDGLKVAETRTGEKIRTPWPALAAADAVDAPALARATELLAEADKLVRHLIVISDMVLHELGVPDEQYPAPVVNTVKLLTAAVERARRWRAEQETTA